MERKTTVTVHRIYSYPFAGSKEFIQHTRSDASNSKPKLRNRIHYVRDHLLGCAVQFDPDTELVENSANADAPDEDELQQQGLFP